MKITSILLVSAFMIGCAAKIARPEPGSARQPAESEAGASEIHAPLPVEPKLLDIKLVGQQENMWCWATTTQMILEYLRRDRIEPDLCDQATVAANRKRTELELCCQDNLSDDRADFCRLSMPECDLVRSVPRSAIDCCNESTDVNVRADYCDEDLRACAQASLRANKRREKEAGKTATISLSPGLADRYTGTIAPIEIDQASYRRRTAPIDCCDPDTVTSYEGYWDCNRGGFPIFDVFNYTAKSTKCPCGLNQLSQLVDLGAGKAKLQELLAEPLFKDAAARIDSTTACLNLLVEHQVTSKAQLDEWLADKQLNIRSRLSAGEDCALNWDVLKGEIDAGRPVAFSWRYSYPGSGHMPVAAGYAVTPLDIKWVLVFDPLPPNNGDWYLVPYLYYVAGPNGRHWRDYWAIQPAQAPGEVPQAPVNPTPGPDFYRPMMLPLSPPTTMPDGSAGTCSLNALDLESSHRQATEGLSSATALIHGAPDFMQRLGFWISGEFKGRLILADKPLAVCELNLEDLKAWKPAEGVETLLQRPNEMVWPILHEGGSETRVVSAVTLRASGGGWRNVKIGGLAAVNLAMTAERPEFVLSVPALSQRFVAYPDRLAPIYPNDFFPPSSSITAGSQEEVLKRLQAVAKEFESPLGDDEDG